MANKCIFNHFGVKAVVYVVENQYKEVEDGVWKQKRRSFPLETIFFEACPDMYRALLRYIKLRLLTGKSEIKLCMVFKRFARKKQIQNQMRVQAMVQNTKDSAFNVATKKVESILFDEYDTDKEEGRVSIAGKPDSNDSAHIQKPKGGSKLIDKS